MSNLLNSITGVTRSGVDSTPDNADSILPFLDSALTAGENLADKFLGPDVNASEVEPSTEWVARARGRAVGVRMGLMDIRGLGDRAMRRIVAARREDGPYVSVADLLSRVRLSREEAGNLALSGALDGLAGNPPRALWQVDAFSRAPCAGVSLPGLQVRCAEPPPAPDLRPYSPLRRLKVEEHLLGMTPSANPMAIYRPLVALGGRACRTADLPRHGGEEVVVAGILFAERRARTRDGQFMKFISLEDETGVVEAVLLPEAYQRLGGRVTTRGPYLVTGTVEDHYGAISLIVSDVRHLALARDRVPAVPA